MVDEAQPAPAGARRRFPRWTGRTLVVRGLFLLVTAISFYVLLPSLLDVFTTWRSLLELSPWWLVAAVGFVAASFVATWALQRIAVGTRSWFAVGTSQLAGNALGRVVPGGMATAGALQYRMLVRCGVPGGRVASGVGASSALLFGTLLALPVLALPAILHGTPVDHALETSAWLGVAVFAVLAGATALGFAFDRPLRFVGEVARAAGTRFPSLHDQVEELPDRLVAERDAIRAALGASWKTAVAASLGKWIFDYLALVAALYAVGSRPHPSVVLLAYVAAQLLGMIPLTPGGLGFVEAGLAGTLVLAGVGGSQALVATLAYRLVSFWLPIPAGLLAYGLFRRRYRAAPTPEGRTATS
jgi:uncharacterized protein (TIRG00374 family)